MNPSERRGPQIASALGGERKAEKSKQATSWKRSERQREEPRKATGGAAKGNGRSSERQWKGQRTAEPGNGCQRNGCLALTEQYGRAPGLARYCWW